MSDAAERSWQERVEQKLDRIEERVAQLEVQMHWRVRLLMALTGLIGAIAAALLGGCDPFPGPAQPPAYTDAALVERSASVTVFCIYPKFGDYVFAADFGSGSGVAVGPDRLVTARHVTDCNLYPSPGIVVDGTPWLIMVKPTGGESSYEFVVEEEGKYLGDDFALLQSTNGRQVFSSWSTPAKSRPAPGDRVCHAAAFPTPGYNCGEVSKLECQSDPDGSGFNCGTEVKPGSGFFHYRGAAGEPGNSGSGVYNTAGELIGVLVGGNAETKSVVAYSAVSWQERVPAPEPSPEMP